jgi:glucosyl-dolichyl phosphate glucuronosyltransferase
MDTQCAVTVVLSTYNRAQELPGALERLLGQSIDATAHEVIVVDNNSSDDTRSVVQRFVNSTDRTLRYVFEPKQGLAHARNAGIAAARADVVAFTDDDVRVSDDWVQLIRRAFDDHPEVDCLGGRTLPIWPSDPPRWLTRRHWVGPLALQDYGDEPFVVDARRPLCLAGANFAFRKSVFSRVGVFSPGFLRCEDTEFMLRLWRGGSRALYVPEMKAFAAVQPERLTKAYHRQWHSNTGRSNARMELAELTARDGLLQPTAPSFARLMGVPRFAVRQLAREALHWLRAAAHRSESETFWHEVQARTIVGYMRESRELFLQSGRNSRG